MTVETAPVLSVRVSARERELLEAAAAAARTSLSDFVRKRAIEAAEIELLDRRIITIPAERWEAFEVWLKSPPKEVPALRRLMASKPVWEA